MPIHVMIARTAFFYFLVLLALRIMGKRQVGELQPFELVIAIMIAELAVLPMEEVETHVLHGVIPIATLMLLELGLAFLTLKSERARSLLCGTPSVVIENGRIVEKELRKLRFNVNDLFEQLRVKDVSDISDVEFAIMETSGELTVIPKSQKRPVTPEDLGIATQYEGISVPIVIDGNVNYKNLNMISLNEKWLCKELGKFGVKRVVDVFYAGLNTKGELFFQLKDSVLKKQDH